MMETPRKYAQSGVLINFRIVQLDPDQELKFTYQQDGNLKAYLNITNLSTRSLAYKVKTTAPRFYVVKPNQGILDKGGRIAIDI